MILIKDGVKRTLNDKETIAIFKDAGWEEFIELKKETTEFNDIDKSEQPKSKNNKKLK